MRKPKKPSDEMRRKIAYWCLESSCGYDPAVAGLVKNLRPDLFKRDSWSVEDIYIEAKKYARRTDFARGRPSAYAKASKLGILEEVCVHMDRLRVWDPNLKARLLALAKSGQLRPTVGTDRRLAKALDNYCRPGGTAYDAELTTTLQRIAPHWFGGRVGRAKHKLRSAVLTGTKPSDSSALWHYVRKDKPQFDPELLELLKSRRPDWLEVVTTKGEQSRLWLIKYAATGAGKPTPASHAYNLLTAYCYPSSRQYSRKTALAILDIRPDWFTAYAARRIRGDAPPRKRRSPRPKITMNELKVTAGKYTTIAEFRTQEPAAYQSARSDGLIYKLFPNTKPVRWSISSAHVALKPYRTRGDAARCAPSAYNYARKHGVLDELCAHMIKPWQRTG